MVVHTCDPTKRQKQEDPKCEARLSYTGRLSLAPAPTRRKSFCLFAFDSQQNDYDRFVYGSQQSDYDRFVYGSLTSVNLEFAEFLKSVVDFFVLNFSVLLSFMSFLLGLTHT